MEEIDVLKEARRVFNQEIAALEATRDSLGEDFNAVFSLILTCKGKVVITGMGKPGHIGAKIASTLASLGTPSFFMHPAEAQHGDLGMLTRDDILLMLSYSGESEEITRLLPPLIEIGCVTVAITGNPKSTLVKQCNYHFIFPHFEEACYMHLAPTSSTTSLLVLGDALAVTASIVKNYTKEDYGLHHPAGSLGKKLLVKVSHLMHSGADNAVVAIGSSLREAIVEMSCKGLSMVTVVDEMMVLKGIITDGDLRRMLENGVNVYGIRVDEVMTKSPKWIYADEMAVNALQMMNDFRITCLPVIDRNDVVVGSILMQDIIKAGIVR
jgi:arabinose-5-phosphate isomerase